MRTESDNFIANFPLKAGNDGNGEKHDGNTKCYTPYTDLYNRSRKAVGGASRSLHAFCYKQAGIQIISVIMRKYISINSKGNKIFLFSVFIILVSCAAGSKSEQKTDLSSETKEHMTVVSDTIEVLMTGAEQTDKYFPSLKDMNIAVVANQTSMIGETHLVDTLKSSGINIKKVFALEHGFRGEVQAGEIIANDVDEKTGIPIVSLYGGNKKPKPEMLKDIDLIIFDIQDVGARFYTYISSLHYVMEAAAENGKKILVLDRPNPNGHYVDGPILNMKHKSFVGMHPVPIVHGMTIGEYARMINEEGWLKGKKKCDLEVITCKGYDHTTLYELPVKPSPNLVNMASIYLYPSLCLFEGTNVSVGRGTEFPFQVIGFPENPVGEFVFTPRSVTAAKTPPFMDVECKGYDLREYGKTTMANARKINLEWLIEFYKVHPDKENFFEKNNMFILLSGNTELKEQLVSGAGEEEIRSSWKTGLEEFKLIRKKYLLYPDFE
jgi:uncharacterized protein YbbC (DUF1343 family)